jgi:hypothetical protein
MKSYDFKCSKCGIDLEVRMPMATATFGDRPCPAKCGGRCTYQVSGAPAVGTANMTNPSFDVVVGKDAEKRWEGIHDRQKARERVRRELYGDQKVVRALRATGTGKSDYEPIEGASVRAVEIPDFAQEKA